MIDRHTSQDAVEADSVNFIRWNLLSLQTQLVTLVTIIIALTMLSITATFVYRDNQQLQQDLEQQGLQILSSIEAAILDLLYLKNVDSTETIAENFADIPGVLNVRVFSDDGRILVDTTDSSLEFSIGIDTKGIQLIQDSNPQVQWLSDRLIVGRRFAIGNQVFGAAQVELSITSLAEGLRTNITQGVVIALIALFATTTLVILVSRRLIQPIIQLADTARAIGEGQFNKPTQQVYGSSEISLLSNTIENMRQYLYDLITTLEKRVAQRTSELELARDQAVKAQTVAEEHTKLKSEFLSTMSHELRTPLNAIEGFTSIMLSGMGIELSDKAYGMVERVNANSKRLLGLINDILDISRIEAGRMEITSTPLNLRNLVNDWENTVAILAADKGIKFDVSVDSELPDLIYGDEDALTKIVVNLLSNAVKFTHQGNVSLNIKRELDNWVLRVADTGIGIPIHAQQYIFDEFRQVDGTSKREYGGTGLGLSLVQKLTIALGGQIRLESELGKGSIFTVTLPLVEVEPANDKRIGVENE